MAYPGVERMVAHVMNQGRDRSPPPCVPRGSRRFTFNSFLAFLALGNGWQGRDFRPPPCGPRGSRRFTFDIFGVFQALGPKWNTIQKASNGGFGEMLMEVVEPLENSTMSWH